MMFYDLTAISGALTKLHTEVVTPLHNIGCSEIHEPGSNLKNPFLFESREFLRLRFPLALLFGALRSDLADCSVPHSLFMGGFTARGVVFVDWHHA